MTSLNNLVTGFIGAGNMSRGIIGGLMSAAIPPHQVIISDPVPEQMKKLQSEFGVRAAADNREAAAVADILLLAVKPQMMLAALASVKDGIKPDALIISVAAGIGTGHIQKALDREFPVVRVMPNTPSLINAGVCGLFASSQCHTGHKALAQSIARAVGPMIWVDAEDMIDVVTGISGSGPAYCFKLMEIMIACARAHGLSAEDANTLVLNTALGAAKLAIASNDEPAVLRRQVTSPGGTTHAAITYMEDHHIETIVAGGIDAAIRRSGELAREFGG